MGRNVFTGNAIGLCVLMTLAGPQVGELGAQLHTEPVAVYGTLGVEQAFGPPGYGESPAVDSIDTYYVVIVPEDRCLSLHQAFGHAPDPHPVECRIQLIGVDPRDAVPLLNKNVEIVGTIFESHTGHHHTGLLIEVARIGPFPAPSAAGSGSTEQRR